MAQSNQRNSKPAQESVCVIPMKEDYMVSREYFVDYAEPGVRNSRRWSFPHLDLVSYKAGVLTIKVQRKYESCTLQFVVQPEHVSIRCSCRQCGPFLCEHAYHALQQMVSLYREDYFKQLLPGGPVDFASRHPNWFRTGWSANQIDIDSRNPTVGIYGFDRPELAKELSGAIELPETVPASNGGQALTYMITIPFRSRWMPAVIPCLGNLTKAGDKVKGFENYLTGIGKDCDRLLTEKQKVLNMVVLELLREVEAPPGQIRKVAEADMGKLQHGFELWRQAFAFLLSEAHVFTSVFFGPRCLRDKPEKQHTQKLTLCPEVLRPAFRWVKKTHCCELSLYFEAGGRKLMKWNKATPFYLVVGEQLFSWGSLRDAAVAEWFPGEGKVIVSKDKYAEFNSTVLSVLKRRYTVVDSSSK